ncbi:MAG TPA: AlkA N-terminal domain-containing protein [Thiobacillaceae bacterium]|nr:AlkA N-terminal domain-containing protein [Thiobacillaceae bacterium]HNF90166.1 AlkA N-terminal domain-containing protein [Thiobacillaceae bacterium]
MDGGGGAGHRLSCDLSLPADFRPQEVLAFHRRDPLRVAECVEGATLRKGLMWAGQPACLTVDLTESRARASLAIDGQATAPPVKDLEALARRMLGLDQPIAGFVAAFRLHPLLGPLIRDRPGLRVPLAASPFEALTWAIAGQQISVHAAVTVRRRLILGAGARHSSGLWCYPDERGVARMREPELRLAGYSGAKARALRALSHALLTEPLPEQAWDGKGETDPVRVEALRTRLLAIPGIGPWTADYALLRGFGWLDGSLHGDAAVRRKLQQLLGRAGKVDAAAARAWLAEFSPWRALVAAHLWAWGEASSP